MFMQPRNCLVAQTEQPGVLNQLGVDKQNLERWVQMQASVEQQ